MFKYCLWYLLKESHPVNDLIKRNAAMLNTKVFPAHITIEHSIGNRDEAKEKLEFCKKGPIPVFGYGGTPYASTFHIRNEYASMTHQFYAIEQPLWINGASIRGIHISLAYRVNGKAFSNIDVGRCISQYSHRIEKDDLKPVIYSCHSENPSDWKLIYD
jgi:hypothetical protein